MSVWNKTGNGSWTEINSIFNKTGSSSWTEILGVWIKTAASTWTRVFTRVLVPANTVPPNVTGSQYLYGALTGTLGTWTSPNGTNSYTRQWQRSTPVGSPVSPSSWGNISGATSSTYTTTDADNGKYIRLNVTATNLSGTSTSASSETLITKYSPVALGLYSLSGVATVGSTLTAQEQIGTWKATTTITNDTYPDTFEYEWSHSDGTVIQSKAFNEINRNTYLILPSDLNKIIRVRVIATNSAILDYLNRGSGTATTGYTSSATVTSVYSFAFGNTLYVGSNGYIGLDNGGNGYLAPGNGRNINIYNTDLIQYKLQEYSDSSNYYLYFRSYRYQSPIVRSAINALDYQIKFYTGQAYCDVTLIRKGSSVPFESNSPGYYGSGLSNFAGLPGPYSWAAGSVLRVYFNGTMASMSAASWTPISDTLWKDITSADIDDSFTSVVTSANQQAPVLTAPVLNSVTPGPQGGLVRANFTGGSGPVYQMFWWGTATAPTVAVTPDGERTFSPVEDPTGPSSTATVYMYVRSVLTAGETSVGPSSVASAWSNGIPFNMTSTDVTQNTAPTTRATNTFSTSTVKYLDSITWSSGTYTNAASITSVLLYSTATSNLVSPGGNTLSSFRTANPYAIVPSDPAGAPYVFAVRDTVVGTNGTTYYFYSNQITSAFADAVAFSYGTATSAAGGWTASVNSGTQSGASYSLSSGTGTVNSSTGQVTVTGLGSNTTTSVIVTKSVSGYNSTNATATGTSATVVIYSLNYSANGGSNTPTTQTGAQGSSITLAANAGTRSGFTFGGWNIGGTTYSGSSSYTFGAADATATAIWNAVFVVPTSPAPSWTSGGNFQRIAGSSILRWYTDYPSISGSGSITGMDFEIRTTAGGGTLLASGTRAYPGAGSYPYSGGGTIWAFRCGTSDGDISYSASARFARVRVRMLGTNGTTYFSPYTGWI
jgi:hypothetical protein